MKLAWLGLCLCAVSPLLSGCFLSPDDPSTSGGVDEGECFDPTRVLLLEPALSPERWVPGRVDGSGVGSLLAISTTDVGAGEVWVLTLLTGTASGEPFVRHPSFELEPGLSLSSTRLHLRDIDGDGLTDLGMLGGGRAVVAYGPLEAGQPTVVEQELPGLRSGTNADFMDFDGDGALDIVMVHEGDDLHSYRALADRTYELVNEGEFDPDVFCIEQLIANWHGSPRFAARGVRDSCGLVDQETRIAVFDVGSDGSFTLDAFNDWVDEVVLRAVGEFFSDDGDELFINDTIYTIQGGSLIARTNVESDLRGDLDGDGVFDHVRGAGETLGLNFGGLGAVDPVQWVDVDSPDFLPVAIVDVDGDGTEEIVGHATEVGPDALIVVGPYVPCELVGDEPTGP